MNNNNLIEKIRSGDQSVLLQLYEMHRNEFLNFALKHYHADIQLAKDAFIDAIIDLRNNITSDRLLHLNSNIKTYLFAIARNKITNEKFSDAHYYYCNEFNEANVEDRNESDEKEEYETKTELIKRLIEKLPGKCYQILKMYYFDRIPLSEIAVALNYSGAESVSTQKYKCYQKLKSMFISVYQHDI